MTQNQTTAVIRLSARLNMIALGTAIDDLANKILESYQDKKKGVSVPIVIELFKKCYQKPKFEFSPLEKMELDALISEAFNTEFRHPEVSHNFQALEKAAFKEANDA